MNNRAGVQINQRSFYQSLVILFIMMMAAGILTLTVPSGQYARVTVEGRELIDPQSFRFTGRPDYPIWRWFTAPIEVLGAPGNLTIITIIIFLIFIGGSFAILEKSGIMKAVLGRVIQRFSGQKYLLLAVIAFIFMIFGALFGIFEEVVPLVPIMIALSYSLGWDALVGLGMSILATNLGFSAALTNPFTIGVAQGLASLPLFSGIGLRILIFLVVYLLLVFFLLTYAQKIDRSPQKSMLWGEDEIERQKYNATNVDWSEENPKLGRALFFFIVCLILILLILVFSPFIPAISDFALPIIGVLFLIGGVGAGILSGTKAQEVAKGLGEGVMGIFPAIPLILMAVSIKHIVQSGGVMDTILHSAANLFVQTSPFIAALIVYFLALLIEFFVASGSAKAFLMMPILLPLADLIGVTRQTTVLAYCFGDGFSNLAYPTNPVLLISLGLTMVSYSKWMRWTAKLWLWVVLATILFLGIAVGIHYGP
ncbi:MAG: YfcC family protein, partial [Anaerolineales bacterium]